MSRHLYPTKRRRAFVVAVSDGEVYSQPGDTHDGQRASFYRDGRRCTHLARECEWAGWIQRSTRLVDGIPERCWWETTRDGNKLIGRIEGAP